MTSPVCELPPVEEFDVRLPKNFFEIMLRLERFGLALFLWLCSLLAVSITLHSWPENRDLGSILLVFFAVALVFTLVAMSRLVYWRVDQVGIQKRCLGVRIWDLPWTAITSYALGPIKSKQVVFVGFLLPIMLGPYQAVLLENHVGRRRQVNRLATNGDRLDALVRYYLNRTGEAEVIEGSAPTIQSQRQGSLGVSWAIAKGWVWEFPKGWVWQFFHQGIVLTLTGERDRRAPSFPDAER